MFVATPPSQFLSILRGSVATNFAGICEVFFTCKLNVNSNAGFEIFNVDSNAASEKEDDFAARNTADGPYPHS